jgi:hypothetical protein
MDSMRAWLASVWARRASIVGPVEARSGRLSLSWPVEVGKHRSGSREGEGGLRVVGVRKTARAAEPAERSLDARVSMMAGCVKTVDEH